MVQQLGGPSAALEAVKPQLNTALGLLGLQGYPAVGLLDADKVLKQRKRRKPPAPAVPAASPAPPSSKVGALPGAPPPKPTAKASKPAATPAAPVMALTKVQPGSKRGKGIHRKVGDYVKETLTTLKNAVVKRKADGA